MSCTICRKWPMISNLRSSENAPAYDGWSEWGRYTGNWQVLLRWFRDGFSWYSYDLRLNIIPANFFWVKCVRFSPCHEGDFRKRPGDFRRFRRISEDLRTLPKTKCPQMFPKAFEHFRSYLRDDTFSVLWYDFVVSQAWEIVLDAWYRCLSEGVNFDWLNGWQY